MLQQQASCASDANSPAAAAAAAANAGWAADSLALRPAGRVERSQLDGRHIGGRWVTHGGAQLAPLHIRLRAVRRYLAPRPVRKQHLRRTAGIQVVNATTDGRKEKMRSILCTDEKSSLCNGQERTPAVLLTTAGSRSEASCSFCNSGRASGS